MEVKNLIATWRSKSSDLKQLNAQLDTAREGYTALEAEVAAEKTELEAQRKAVKSSVDEVQSRLDFLKAEKKAFVEENKKHQAKVNERVEKNRHHKSVLEERNNVLLQQSNNLNNAEAGIRARLAAFREEKQRVQEQMAQRSAVAKETLPNERAGFEDKLTALRERLAAVKKTRDLEEKAWEKELARRRSEVRAANRNALLNDAQQAQQDRQAWLQLARCAPTIHGGADVAAIAAGIRSKIHAT